jgi:hypothetical protein
MANNRVMTAPLAVIKVGGITVGKMKNIRITESFTRQQVVGLGTLVASELPVTAWQGTMSCDFMTIDLKKSMVPGAINRISSSIEDWTNTVLLQDEGVQVDIFKRVKDPQQPDDQFPNASPDPNFVQRVIAGKYEIFASVRGAFLTTEGFDISEGAISSRQVSFQYKEPILYPNF